MQQLEHRLDALPKPAAPLPPLASGLPFLGSALRMAENPLPYLVGLFDTLGPIYRVRALGREYTVMAGVEANVFLAREGEDYLSSADLFGGFAREMNTDTFLVALDGPAHRHLRKQMRRGYSRSAIEPHLEDVANITRRFARSWQPDQRLAILPTLQRIVTEQLGVILVNHAPGEYFEDIQLFLTTIMNATVMKTWPTFMLRWPRYVKAKARVLDLARKVVAEHRQSPPGDGPEGRPRDLVDDMLEANDLSGRPLSEHALVAATIGPFFAGMDTVASTCGFMLYAVLKQPDVYHRVLADVDSLFAGGSLDIRDLKEHSALYGATIETLRMYPVAAFTPRTSTQAFEFAGCSVPAGKQVLIGNAVTHYLAEYFPEPERFDIDRYSEPRNEHRQANVFAPFTLGAHTCLGAGMAEVQIMLTMASLLHTVELTLDPPDAVLEVKMTPIPSPGRKLAVKVSGQRHPPGTP